MKRAMDEPQATAFLPRDMGRGADGCVDDALLGHVVALESCDGMAAGHHHDAVAEPLQLQRVA